MKFLSISEIFENYPVMLAETGWSKEDIRDFYEGKLLIGKYTPENSTHLDDLRIEKSSMESLINYYRNLKR